MNKKNIIPQAVKPVVRVSPGTQADLLAELSEEVLASSGIAAAVRQEGMEIEIMCSYDGNDAE